MIERTFTYYQIYASPQRSPATVDISLDQLPVWSISRYVTTSRQDSPLVGEGSITTSFVTGGLTYAEAQAYVRDLEAV